MFPEEGDPKPWEEYGEVIDPEEFGQKKDDPMDLRRNLVSARCAWRGCRRKRRPRKCAEVAWFKRILDQFVMIEYRIEV
jgi:hypothetical protein